MKLQTLQRQSSVFSLELVTSMYDSNAYQPHKYACFHIYLFHVHCLHAPIILPDNTYQIKLAVLLLLPVAACADSCSTPSSISDGALAMLGQPRCKRWKRVTTTTSHASLPIPSLTSSLILALL
jgi:hypothetical protein